MALDATLSAMIAGIVTPLITTGGLLGVAWIRRQPSKLEDQKQADDAKHSVFEQASELTEYIDARVDARTEQLREELEDVKSVMRSLYGRLNRVRNAVREHISEWRLAWGKQPMPPPLSQHIRELLDEDYDEDTLTAEQISDIINRPAPAAGMTPTPAPSEGSQ